MFLDASFICKVSLEGAACKILPSGGHILDCNAFLLNLPLPGLPVNYGGLEVDTSFTFKLIGFTNIYIYE